MTKDRGQTYLLRRLALDGAFAKSGDNQHTANKGGRDNITTRSQRDGGTSAAYLAARLKKAGRDDLLEQVGPEKPYRSIRAAAIEAGIIKPVPTDAAASADLQQLLHQGQQLADAMAAVADVMGADTF